MPFYKLKLGGKTMKLPDGQHDIGRMSDCWLTLDDELASRYHARLHVAGRMAELEDLGSRNGTYINGERVAGRRRLLDGDRIRIGRELITVIGGEHSSEDEDNLRRTLAPGEDTRFPSLIGQLVEKSLKVGKIKEAERYAGALLNQLALSRVPADHPAAQAVTRCLLAMAEKTRSGSWVDRLFRLYATQAWVMSEEALEAVREALDRIPRIPGSGIRDYEATLRGLAREGTALPDGLTATIGELADAYGSG